MEDLKKRAAYKAVDDYIRSNMIIGLGTGSTVFFVLERIASFLKDGTLENITCIPTSTDTEVKAKKLNIPLSSLYKDTKIDVAIDGTDEIDFDLNLIKGRGGALLREKLVAENTDLFIIVCDESKLCVNGLGLTGALPVEILNFGHEKIIEKLLNIAALKNCTYQLRKKNEQIFITDNNNYIVDLFFTSPIDNLVETSKLIKMTTGVIDHGIFINLAKVAILSKSDGTFTILKKNEHTK